MGSPLLNRLTIRERPGQTCFRFWQEGPGFDRNLFTLKAIEAAIDYKPFEDRGNWIHHTLRSAVIELNPIGVSCHTEKSHASIENTGIPVAHTLVPSPPVPSRRQAG